MTAKLKIKYKGKIALCFLVVQNIKNINLWRKFIEGYEEYINIYSHISGDKYNLQNYWQPELWDNRVENYGLSHVPTKWGTVSLVEAESIMYRAALKNKENIYFCIISESDIPLWTFPEFYNIITRRPKKSYLALRSIRYSDSDIFLTCFPEKYIPSSNKARSREQRNRRHWQTWAASQWKILNRRDAKEFINMTKNKLYMNSYNNCFIHDPKRLAPDEYMFGNWIVLKYGVKELKARFIRHDSTFADFDSDDPTHALEYDNIDKYMKEDLCDNKPVFARKFKPNSTRLERKVPVRCRSYRKNYR